MIAKSEQTKTTVPTGIEPGRANDNARWERIVAQILPRLERRLRARFPYLRFALSVESRLQSAVCHCLHKELLGTFEYKSDAELEFYLFKTACSKIVGAIEKEHFDRRQPGELAEVEYEDIVDSSCEEAAATLAEFRNLLDDEEKLVLDGRLDGMSMPMIASVNGRELTDITTIWKAVTRKASRQTVPEESSTVE